MANNNAELRRLAARIEECCESIGASDKLALSASRRLDKLQRRLEYVRAETRTRLAELKLRVEHIELHQRGPGKAL